MNNVNIKINNVTIDLSEVTGTKVIDITPPTTVTFVQKPLVKIGPNKPIAVSVYALAKELGLRTQDDFLTSMWRDLKQTF
jgi:hypothetical protein